MPPALAHFGQSNQRAPLVLLPLYDFWTLCFWSSFLIPWLPSTNDTLFQRGSPMQPPPTCTCRPPSFCPWPPSIAYLTATFPLSSWLIESGSFDRSDFPGGTKSKIARLPTQETRDVGLIPESGRSLEKETATHSSIPAWRTGMARVAWRATVHGAAKRQPQLKRLSAAAV